MAVVMSSIRLRSIEMEALNYIAAEEGKSIEEMVEWIVLQNIPSLLDVMEAGPRRDELARRLVEEQD